MLGLNSYDSSDEDNTRKPLKESKAYLDFAACETILTCYSQAAPISQDTLTTRDDLAIKSHVQTSESDANRDAAIIDKALSNADASNGAALGPSIGPTMQPLFALSSESTPTEYDQQHLQSLTMPPVPNLDIPGSPLGDAPANSTARFAHFLELKKQGVHFNAKLAQSSALRNPSLLQKLLEFADVDELGQYADGLPDGLTVTPPGGFPSWAYVEELNKRQEEIRRRREDERAKGTRDIEFVSRSASSSRVTTPVGIGKGPNRSGAAERVTDGLNTEMSRSPNSQDARKRKETEHRKSRFDDRDWRH